MDLKNYFENTDGLGVLSTADTAGHVDAAIYATPHVMDEHTIAFIMRPRTSLSNVQHNPNAVYLFVEQGPGYQGRRLYLEKTGQEDDPAKINLLRRSSHGSSGDEADAKLIYFKVVHVRPLVGDKDPA